MARKRTPVAPPLPAIPVAKSPLITMESPVKQGTAQTAKTMDRVVTASPLKGRPLRERALSTKFLLTAGSLIAVFYMLYLDKAVDKLEILVPAILLFYSGVSATQDIMNRRSSQMSYKETTQTKAPHKDEDV